MIYSWWLDDPRIDSERRRDAVLERAEREEANQRLRTWRCEQLVYKLMRFGIHYTTAAQIAESVWEEPLSWTTMNYVRNPIKLVSFRRSS